MTTQVEPENHSEVLVVKVTNQAMLEQAYAVRLEVFVNEQDVPLEEELDALDTDPTTIHVIAVESVNPSGGALGTARLLPTPGQPTHFHIGRVAVHKSARGRDVGAALMGALEQVAVSLCAPEPAVIELSAQIQASGFYRRLGYEQHREEQYLDAGIWHVDMVKTLS